MAGPEESILDAIYGDEELESETLESFEEDTEMVDADAGGGYEAGEGDGETQQANPNGDAAKRRKKNKKKKRKRNSGSAPTITDMNRFVLDTCRRLKEKKSYLVWNAVGCLGVSALSDLVKEVDAIQRCGGQKIIGGTRFRTGGGILWNILKTREPNAYKEIMAKGKEFEKQLWQPKKKHKPDMDETADSQNNNAFDEAAGEVLNSSERLPEQQPLASESLDLTKERVSVKDRMRVPVTYDDLFEEGEINE